MCLLPANRTKITVALLCTVISAYKESQCKDNFDVRTTQLVSNQRILTAVAPLSEDNLIQGQFFGSWIPKHLLQ